MFTIFFYNTEKAAPIVWYEFILGRDLDWETYLSTIFMFISPTFLTGIRKALKGFNVNMNF